MPIRCDWLLPDAEAQAFADGGWKPARNLCLPGGRLLALWACGGVRQPLSAQARAQWLSGPLGRYDAELTLTHLAVPATPAAPGQTPAPKPGTAALMEEADARAAAALPRSATWLAYASGAQAQSREGRHAQACEGLSSSAWLDLKRMDAAEMLTMAQSLAGLRHSAPAAWPGLDSPDALPGAWFAFDRNRNAIRLGNYWWAGVCVASGPAHHRDFTGLVLPSAPLILTTRLAGGARRRFSARAGVARALRRAGNEPLVDAHDALLALPEGGVFAASMCGLAGAPTADEALDRAAALAGAIEAWLGCRCTLHAAAGDVLAHCVPGFTLSARGLRLPEWPAAAGQAAGLLPAVGPASPWARPDPLGFVPPARGGEKPAPAVFTGGQASARSLYPFDLFVRAQSHSAVIAGTSGSGKSLGLARIAWHFTRQYPRSPVRILDAGRSAAPLAAAWRDEGGRVAEVDLSDLPDCNLLAPPFPMLEGGPLLAEAVKAIVRILHPGLKDRQETAFETALSLAWGQAREGMLEGRSQAHANIEAALAAGALAEARAFHAQACATLEDVLELVSTPAVRGGTPGSRQAAGDLAEALSEAMPKAQPLTRPMAARWQGAARVVAELGPSGSAEPGKMERLRYAVALHLLSGDLAPTDWQTNSAPGEASRAWAKAEAAARLREPKLLMADEAHRLRSDPQALKFAARIALEGRKARLGLVMASQFASHFPPFVVEQAPVRVLFGQASPSERQAFGFAGPPPAGMAAGDATLGAAMADGTRWQARVRAQMPPEHLWALASSTPEVAAREAFAEALGDAGSAVRLLAHRLPGGKLPPDAPPPEALVEAWANIKGKDPFDEA